MSTATLRSTRVLLVGGTDWVETVADALTAHTDAAVETADTAASPSTPKG